MNKLDKYITKEIVKYMTNEDVFKIGLLNTFYSDLFDLSFVKYIKNRRHPLVFNVYDNMCSRCNLNYITILAENSVFLRCGHAIF